MNFTKIKKWCADNPDARVEMYFTDIGIELEMQLNLGSQIKRKISYTELKSSNVDIIRLNLNEMYKSLVDNDGISQTKWIEYVATYSYLTIEEAKILYPLCKSINMQREQAIALLQSKGDLELLYYTITHEGMIS